MIAPPLGLGIPAGRHANACAHMAYLPRSAMAFAADLHHDFRGFQADQRLETIIDWVSLVSDTYLNAARLLAAKDDPIANCLRADPLFDARTVWNCHDLMATHWRYRWFDLALEGKHRSVEWPFTPQPIRTYRDLQDTFRGWLFAETADWARHDPPWVRLICLAVVGNHTPQGQLVELELMAHLANRYPLRVTPN